MITTKEIISLIFALLILAFSKAFIDLSMFLTALLLFAVILIVYVFSKKAMAYYLECREEIKIWSFQRYWFHERDYFKTPLPVGILIPFILSVLSLGWVPWYAVLESDIQPTSARATRKHDFYSFSELTEWHIGLISAAGIFSCFILSFLAYLINYPELSKLAIYFACFNLIPLGKLDGTKIFFGSKILYAIFLILALIGLTYAIGMA